jgi:hypothetical protein
MEKRFFTSFRMTISRFYRDCQLVPVVSLKGDQGMLPEEGQHCLGQLLWSLQAVVAGAIPRPTGHGAVFHGG